MLKKQFWDFETKCRLELPLGILNSTLTRPLKQTCDTPVIHLYLIGYGKTAHFAHYFKIELLDFKGSVDLKQ